MCQLMKSHRGVDKTVMSRMAFGEEKNEARNNDWTTARGRSNSMRLRSLESEEGNWALRMRQEGMRLAQK